MLDFFFWFLPRPTIIPQRYLIAVWNFLSGPLENAEISVFCRQKFSSLVQSWIKWIGSSNCEITHPEYFSKQNITLAYPLGRLPY
jgi:hypothetical protein